MPIYDYQCRKCSHVFWKLVKVCQKESPLVCPKCGGKKLERLLSSFNTKFYLERAEEAGRDMLQEWSESGGGPITPQD